MPSQTKLSPASSKTPSFPPTPEQEHILSLVKSTKSNLLINALAGSGKTSTLELIQAAVPAPVLCLAFNKRIATEMEKRFLSTTTVRTLNGLGHRIWSATCAGRITLDAKKCQDILREKIKGLDRPAQREAYDSFWDIISAVGMAKSVGYVPEGVFPNAKRLCTPTQFFASLDQEPTNLEAELIDEVLAASITAAYAGSIDFNDQVYMPALFGGTYPKFPLVLVDEAQDLSPVNHQMLAHLSKSRIIAVGDPFQSIYGFRGAVQNGMSHLRKRFEMEEADLSVSFRCPEAIVRNVHWRVPHMKWSKPGGRVGKIANPNASSFVDSGAIICRNNAPLFACALRLLGAGRSVSVSGSDIGPRLIGMMKRLGDENMTQAQLLGAIDDWEVQKLAKESKSAPDLAECMRVFASHGANLGQAIAYAEHLFAQEGKIQLLTGHKAKGLEWNTVYHLDEGLIGTHEQELNLRYVIQTRAMETYYEVESREINWNAP